MKYSLRLTLILFMIIVYPCRSKAQVKKQLIDTPLIFPKFIVNLHSFFVHAAADGTSKFYYNGDSYEGHSNIDENKPWSLHAKTDTVHLQIYSSTNNIIELIPNDKTDNFKVSYYSKVAIIELNNKKGINLTIISPCKLLKDSLNYFFKIPEGIYDSETNPNVDDIKSRLKLQDKIVDYKDIDGKYHRIKTVIYENKACEIYSVVPVYLKIERFNKNKLMGTKFLTIEEVNSEDAD